MRTESPLCVAWGIDLKKIKPPFGIRSRILIYLLIFAGLIVSLLWLFQITLLNEFYKIYSIRQLNHVAATLASNLDHEDLEQLAQRLSLETDICVLIVDDEA